MAQVQSGCFSGSSACPGCWIIVNPGTGYWLPEHRDVILAPILAVILTAILAVILAVILASGYYSSCYPDCYPSYCLLPTGYLSSLSLAMYAARRLLAPAVLWVILKDPSFTHDQHWDVGHGRRGITGCRGRVTSLQRITGAYWPGQHCLTKETASSLKSDDG